MTTREQSEQINKAIDNVFAEMKRDSLRPTSAVRFGNYLKAKLTEIQMTPDELSRRLDMDIEVLEAILEGMLPSEEIDDLLIESIASTIHTNADVLRVFLGQTVNTNVISQAHAPALKPSSKT